VDRTLIEAARSGDEEAFASIARSSADRLFAVAYRILRDIGRAEDAVQQTLVQAWRQLPELREVDRFEAWIHRILVHACYDEAKRARRWSANVTMLPVDGPATPDTTLSVATRDALDRGFRRLPPEQCAVFVLHHSPDRGSPDVI
jgi:RNA polymerase sigma-70 factor, ECF subfamily